MATDIVLLDAEWPSRALLRAQLIEEGFDVLATDTWATMRRYHSTNVGYAAQRELTSNLCLGKFHAE